MENRRNHYASFEDELLANLKRRFQTKEPHQGDYEFFRYSTGETGLFLDIGANFGLSVASLRLYNTTAKIMSFEPLPWMEKALRHLRELDPELFDYKMVAVSDTDGTLSIGIPSVNGIPNFFRASAQLDKFDNATTQENIRKSLGVSGHVSVQTIKAPSIRLDTLKLEPALIKVDVEGYESKVLAGGWKTITRFRPVLFLELSSHRTEIITRLSSIQYSSFSYEGQTIRDYKHDRHTDNVAFIPTERVDEIKMRLQSGPGAQGRKAAF